MKKIEIIVAAFVMALLLCPVGSVAQQSSQATDGSLSSLKVGLLPLGNLTNKNNAYKLATDYLQTALQKQRIDYVSSEELRPTLRKYRIRSQGKLSLVDAVKIRKEREIDLFLLGSVDIYQTRGIPEFAISLRLITADDMIIRAAITVANSGRDFESLFGSGLIDDIDELAKRVIDRAVVELFMSTEHNKVRTGNFTGNLICIIPYENITKNRYAGQITTNWLISELVANNRLVIEPGSVERLLRPYGGSPVGSISLPHLRLLFDSLSVKQVLTGQVDLFKLSRGSSPNSFPAFAFGARLLNAETGTIISAFDAEANGSQSETIFQLGRRYALGKLVTNTLQQMLNSFERRMIAYED